nr:MAG TPA: hypothetical protein [Caudoviricetes sp.]
MKKININPQEVYVWLAYSDGWHKYAGHIITIQGIRFSVIVLPAKSHDGYDLVFSSLDSGSKFRTVPLNVIEFLNCDTKEKTLVQYAKSAIVVMSVIDNFGKKKVLDVIKKAELENKKKFGDMPAIEKIEMV